MATLKGNVGRHGEMDWCGEHASRKESSEMAQCADTREFHELKNASSLSKISLEHSWLINSLNLQNGIIERPKNDIEI